MQIIRLAVKTERYDVTVPQTRHLCSRTSRRSPRWVDSSIALSGHLARACGWALTLYGDHQRPNCVFYASTAFRDPDEYRNSVRHQQRILPELVWEGRVGLSDGMYVMAGMATSLD